MQHRHRAIARIAVGFCLLAGANGIAQAQTVMGSGTAARCVENVGNGELACGSGSVANPGTGATAIGINASATADAAMAFGFQSIASSISATAFGKDAEATNQGSVAVGQGSRSTGNASTALGFVGDTATANDRSETAVAEIPCSTNRGQAAENRPRSAKLPASRVRT